MLFESSAPARQILLLTNADSIAVDTCCVRVAIGAGYYRKMPAVRVSASNPGPGLLPTASFKPRRIRREAAILAGSLPLAGLGCSVRAEESPPEAGLPARCRPHVRNPSELALNKNGNLCYSVCVVVLPSGPAAFLFLSFLVQTLDTP